LFLPSNEEKLARGCFLIVQCSKMKPEARIVASLPSLRIHRVGVVRAPPATGKADGFDTEHLFGFTIGTDVGNVGEREVKGSTTARLAKQPVRMVALCPRRSPQNSCLSRNSGPNFEQRSILAILRA
jgi:hypothetical protein